MDESIWCGLDGIKPCGSSERQKSCFNGERFDSNFLVLRLEFLGRRGLHETLDNMGASTTQGTLLGTSN